MSEAMHSSMHDKILHILVFRLRKYKTTKKEIYFEAKICDLLPPLPKITVFLSRSHYLIKPIYFLEAVVKLHINK